MVALPMIGQLVQWGVESQSLGVQVVAWRGIPGDYEYTRNTTACSYDPALAYDYTIEYESLPQVITFCNENDDRRSARLPLRIMGLREENARGG
jgi:hypothetical protein